jgi:hypothetical protein
MPIPLSISLMSKIYNFLTRHCSWLVYLKRRWTGAALRKKNLTQVFDEIYQTGEWARGDGSLSGPGSDRENTKNIRKILPELCRELSVSTLLDIPCGDLTWISSIDLPLREYHGADIVKALIDRNKELYSSPTRRFSCLDIVSEPIPHADLVLVRDLFIHLTSKQIHAALKNVCNSKSTWLLTTTYSKLRKNTEIVHGQYRPINLCLPPFSLPTPLRLIDEDVAVPNDLENGRCLGLWKVDTIEQVLKVMG